MGYEMDIEPPVIQSDHIPPVFFVLNEEAHVVEPTFAVVFENQSLEYIDPLASTTAHSIYR